jgi:hypothetical protein
MFSTLACIFLFVPSTPQFHCCHVVQTFYEQGTLLLRENNYAVFYLFYGAFSLPQNTKRQMKTVKVTFTNILLWTLIMHYDLTLTFNFKRPILLGGFIFH